MTKRYAGLLGALLVVGLIGAFRGASQAQDTYTGRSQFTRHFNATTINGGATVVSASTGKKITVKALVGKATTAGDYTFYATIGGNSTPIGTFYFTANAQTSKIFNEADLGRGLAEGDAGTAITCVGPGVLTVILRTQEQ